MEGPQSTCSLHLESGGRVLAMCMPHVLCGPSLYFSACMHVRVCTGIPFTCLSAYMHVRLCCAGGAGLLLLVGRHAGKGAADLLEVFWGSVGTWTDLAAGAMLERAGSSS